MSADGPCRLPTAASPTASHPPAGRARDERLETPGPEGRAFCCSTERTERERPLIVDGDYSALEMGNVAVDGLLLGLTTGEAATLVRSGCSIIIAAATAATMAAPTAM